MTTDYRAMSRRQGLKTVQQIVSEQAEREHAAQLQDPAVRRQQTREEVTRDRIARSSRAWAAVRAKVAGWPPDLARAEMQRVADHFGSEPAADGAAAARAVSERQAAALVSQLPADARPDRGEVDEATRIAAERLLRGTRSQEEQEQARRMMRPPAER